MRIRRLHLLRYGHFTDAVVEFPPSRPDLQIVYGPNEAGKSTTMCGIEDLLFGIPANSPHNFLHEYGAMRVGATLESGAQAMTVRRRKGNKDTLLTEQEVPVPAGEGILTPLLGGADRRFFTRMFSLDHERLRQGGREILEARDDVGQMLFSASAGILGLRDRLKAMEEEADGLWAPRRAGHRKYYQADDKLKAAEAALRDHLVTASKWQEAKSAYEAATEAYQALEHDTENKSSEQRKLGRIRRVCRDVRRRLELDALIRDMGPVVSLPEDALARLDQAAREDANAMARISTLKEQFEVAKTEREAMRFDEALLLRAEDISQFHERRIEVRAEKVALPKRKAELESAQANLLRLAAELEWTGDSTDQLITRIPARAKLADARMLLNRRSGQLAAVENAQAALTEAEERVSELAARIDEAETPADVSMLTAVIRATRELGDLDSRVAAAERDFQDAQRASQHRMSTQRPPIVEEATLAAAAVPPVDSVQAHRDRGRELDQRMAACRERIRTTEQDLIRHRRSYDRIVSDEDVISPEELAKLRQRRDLGWSIIRRHFVDGTLVPDDEINIFAAGGDIPDAYEAAVRNADQAADQRFTKAEAAAQLAVIARQIAEQKDLLESLRNEQQTIEVEQARHAESWTAMWDAVPITPLDSDVMLEWLETREDILDLCSRRDAAQHQRDGVRTEVRTAKDRLLAELGGLGLQTASLAQQPVRVILESALDLQKHQETLAETRSELQEALRKVTGDLDRRKRALKKAEDGWSEWTTQWTAALAVLGLAGASTPETTQAQINVIDKMHEVATRINDLRHERIEKIERDIRAFERDVRELVQSIAAQFATLEAEDAVIELERLLAENTRAHEQAAEKDAALADLQKKIEECEEARRGALDAIRTLQAAAGADSIEALRTAIERSDRLRTLQTEQDTLTDALGKDGDGLSVAELTEECLAIDFDQIASREQTVNGELQDLRNRLMEARETRNDARRTFEAIGGDDRAARDASDRQSALAEIREIAERYVRLRSATLVLRWAIDRYRREKQAPLLKRAGELFAILTLGSFASLRLEFDDHDNAQLAGIRSDGLTVSISGMSTGTADQLYLALRVAAIEDYLERAAPLPFVADDLFVNFDDRRAVAGFAVLSELAKKTQVLFFTHHQHLVEIAKKALGPSIFMETLELSVVASAKKG